MQEMLLRIQEACLEMDPKVLWGPALIAIVVGLFLWLGGMRYSFLVVGLLGAVVGGAAGLFVGQWFDLSPLICVVAGAALLAIGAVLMEHTIIMLLATLIFALVCGVSYWGYSLESDSWKEALSRARAQAIADSAAVTIPAAPTRSADFAEPTDQQPSAARTKLQKILADLRLSLQEQRTTLFLWILLGAGVGLILGYLLKKLMMAVCCSIVGTSAIIGGVVALLLAKGRPIFTDMQSHSRVLPTIFFAMIAFGLLTQLLLGKTKKTTKVSEDEEEE